MNNDYSHDIKAARPTNLGRISASLIFFVIAYIFSIQMLGWIALFHIIIGLAWLLMIEKFYNIYLGNPGLWYVNSLIDLGTLTIFVFLTGATHSFVIIGYIIMTTLSSMDLNRSRGIFAVLVGICFYVFISMMVYLDVFPFINIMTQNKESVTIFGLVVSILLTSIGNIVVHMVVYSIHFKLNESNKDLKQQFEEIQKLKFQQDGDYYLTSLLLEPLMNQNFRPGLVTIESYVSQYKKFQFRNEVREIGGDVIIYDSILLSEKRYCVFLNGDAMGKSIQGAGGALVLGVVFKSILTRTKEVISNKKPEDWILSTYHEIQYTFETFDGFMLASAIFGLIDEMTGELFYINLEHPHMILYRNDTANMLEPEGIYPKLGTPILNKPSKIERMQLEKGDVLFLGSDGKDDLKIPMEGKSDSYNQDDTLFLQMIEENSGKLKNILKSFSNYGKIIDDLSILKIQYLGMVESGHISREETGPDFLI